MTPPRVSVLARELRVGDVFTHNEGTSLPVVRAEVVGVAALTRGVRVTLQGEDGHLSVVTYGRNEVLLVERP